MCNNGGTCVTGAGAPFICICPDGFSGETCNETETGKRHPWGLFPYLLVRQGQCSKINLLLVINFRLAAAIKLSSEFLNESRKTKLKSVVNKKIYGIF